MSRSTKKKKTPRSKPASLFVTIIALIVAMIAMVSETITPVRMPQGHGPAELYSNQAGDDLRNTILGAITSAKESIVLAVYNLSDAKVINALKAKADAGVNVYVVVDVKASPQAQRNLGPKITTIRRSAMGLMHLKILLIDNKQVWLGSANMSYDSLRTHGNLIIAMENEPLAHTLDSFLKGMPDAGPITQPAPAPIRFAQEGQDGDLWMLPNSTAALHTLIDLIKDARHSLQIAMFTWTHPALTDAIIAAKKRGVDVTIVIDNNQGHGAGAEVVHRLREAGVQTYLSKGDGLLHYKMAIIDDAILVIGSANWTRSAFSRNDDCFVVLWPMTSTQQDYLRRTWGVVLHESDRGVRY